MSKLSKGGAMQAFFAAQAAGSDWRAACRSCVEQLAGLPPTANLGFVYASEPLSSALDLIVGELRRATSIGQWVGTGSAAVCSSGHEYASGGALTLLVAALPDASFCMFDRLDTADRGSRAPGPWGHRAGRPAFGVAHGDGRQARLPETLADLADEVFLVGGLSTSRGSPLQIAGSPTEGGLSGVVLDSAQVPLVTGLSQGCTPIGPVHEVSASRGSWLSGLDGRPALTVLEEEVGDILARRPGRIGGFIHAALPVEGSDGGDYLVRNLLGIDAANGAIALGMALRRGQRLMFVKRDGDAARADLKRMLGDLRRRTEGRPVRGALYHACVARGANLFGPDSTELGMIEAALGPVPLAGFFAAGEIFHNRLYAYSGVLTLFL
jgi:small ligand-binding sensory domain FIST